MVKVCCVKNCDNRSTRESDKKYFSLPGSDTNTSEASDDKTRGEIELRRTRWIDAIKGSCQDAWEAKDYHTVCSDHFWSGEPAETEDVRNIDWVPTLKMGHVADAQDVYEVEDVDRRWPNWENFVRRIMAFLKTGVHEEDLTKPEQRAVQKAAKTYYLEDGILYHQRSGKPLKVVMLETEHRDIILQNHIMESGNHSGINATVDRISSRYFWRGIKQDVVRFISQCCGKQKDLAKLSVSNTQEKDFLEHGGDASESMTALSTMQQIAASISKRKSDDTPTWKNSSEDSAKEQTVLFKNAAEDDGEDAAAGGTVCHKEVSSATDKTPFEDDIVILDEIEGTFVKVDRKNLVPQNSGDDMTLTADSQTDSDVPASTMGTKRQEYPARVSDYTKDSALMPASATILKLASTASQEKTESSVLKNPSNRTSGSSVPSKPKPILPKPSTAATALKAQIKPEGDCKASAKTYRSFAWSLHNIGMRLVRQQVYKNLVEIQEVKDEQKRLDESEKKQLEKLRGYYLDLRQKNKCFMIPGRRCRCGYRVASLQELDLHQEYGHGWESGRYDCCLCKFASKVFSVFSSHMAKEHGRKARFQLPLAPFVCPYCPFEHRHNTKKKLLRHIANCELNFKLDNNLSVRAIDCDIPLLAPPPQSVPAVTTDSGASTPNSGKPPTSTCSSAVRNQRSVLKSSGGDTLANGSGAIAMMSSVGSGLPAKTTHLADSGSRSYLVCELCGGFVRDRDSLLLHLRIAHKVNVHLVCAQNSEPPIGCKSCSEKFWTKIGLNLHISLMHCAKSDDPPPTATTISVCPLCKRTRLTDVMLHLAQQHRVTLLDMFLMRYCALCLLELHSGKAFEDHMTTRHSTLYPSRGSLMNSVRSLEQFRPNNASRQSALLVALINRNRPSWKLNSSRNPLQMFSCPICRCQFGTLDSLTCHFEQVHSYRCSHCEYRCGSAELLRRHFRNEHDSMDFCPICKMKIHSGSAAVEHFEKFHLNRCSVVLNRVSGLMEPGSGIKSDDMPRNLESSIAKLHHPSSLSDGSSAGSVSDDEANGLPPSKRLKLDETF